MSIIRNWVLYTASTYSIQCNKNLKIKSQPDFIHKGLPIVWLIAQSENSDSVKELFRFINKDLPILCSSDGDSTDKIVIKYHTADNSAAIQSAVSDVFPDCIQGNCVVHAKMSLRKKSISLGHDSNKGKVVERYRMMAPECPSLLSFKTISTCVLTFLRNSASSNGYPVAKAIEEFYVKGQKCNWFHVSSGLVSNANVN